MESVLLLLLLASQVAAPSAGQSSGLAVAASSVTGAAAPGPLSLRAGEDATVRACARPLTAAGDCIPIPPAAAEAIRWWVLKPIARDYSNEGSRGLARIEYAWRSIDGLAGRSEFLVSKVPLLATEGSHRIAVTLAGEPPDGELTPEFVLAHFEIVVRRDDSYLGHVAELVGVPFVLWPRRLASGIHQTDARLAADCVALVIYGRRRLGRPMPYVAPRRLRAYLKPLGRCDNLESPCEMAKPVAPGDVLHFDFQTAVLSVDNPPVGTLDPSDLVLHAYHGLAEERAIRELPYRAHSVDVYRWPP